ncbi:metal-dependent hydrolase [Myxococcota bacterium]|nr:metal-dependent hydrolase [Myxococcota bacterium]
MAETFPSFMQMLEWHFVEELEHRHVAFDVYEHVCGGYFYRLFVGLYTQWHFTRWIRRVAKYMLRANAGRKISRGSSDVVAGARLKVPTLQSVLPQLLRSYMPGYSPHEIEVSPGIEALAEKCSAMAVKRS